MQICLNNLYNFFYSKKDSKRVGRGIGSGKGKTSGRGVKGQKARSGVSIRWFEGGQTSLIKRLAKRGFNSLSKVKIQLVSINKINQLVDFGLLSSGSSVDKDFLFKYGIISNAKLKVKLLGSDELKTSLNFNLDYYSESAKKSIDNSNSVLNG